MTSCRLFGRMPLFRSSLSPPRYKGDGIGNVCQGCPSRRLRICSTIATTPASAGVVTRLLGVVNPPRHSGQVQGRLWLFAAAEETPAGAVGGLPVTNVASRVR